jgi:TATA-box binding protein (TBP) (component of TFIID and TFIIIB)
VLSKRKKRSCFLTNWREKRLFNQKGFVVLLLLLLQPFFQKNQKRLKMAEEDHDLWNELFQTLYEEKSEKKKGKQKKKSASKQKAKEYDFLKEKEDDEKAALVSEASPPPPLDDFIWSAKACDFKINNTVSTCRLVYYYHSSPLACPSSSDGSGEESKPINLYLPVIAAWWRNEGVPCNVGRAMYPAITLYFTKPRGCVNLSSGGHVVCTGAGSRSKALFLSRRTAFMLCALLKRRTLADATMDEGALWFAEANRSRNKQQQQHRLPAFHGRIDLERGSFHVDNIASSVSLPCRINLKGLARMNATKCSYSKQNFPGASLRLREMEPIAALVFDTGKLVITGARKKSQLKRALALAQRVIFPHALFDDDEKDDDEKEEETTTEKRSASKRRRAAMVTMRPKKRKRAKGS